MNMGDFTRHLYVNTVINCYETYRDCDKINNLSRHFARLRKSKVMKSISVSPLNCPAIIILKLYLQNVCGQCRSTKNVNVLFLR